jgi:hypothetical protein
VNGDSVSSVTLTSAGAAATASVAGSPYAIVASAAVGSGLGNYLIGYVNGALTVTQKALTVTANSTSKTYGQTVTFAGSEFTTSGLVNGDSVSSVTLTSAGAAATANVAGSPYAIVASAAVGSGLGNYLIGYVNGVLTVTPKALTVTANSLTKIQGEANPAFTVSYNGFVLGQGAGVLGGALTFTTSATTSSLPGTYTVTPGGLTSSNYAITFVPGTLTVISFAQAVTNLQTLVDTSGLSHGIQRSLDNELEAVLDDLSRGRTHAAAERLEAFIDHVSDRNDRQISDPVADSLIAAAKRIINALGDTDEGHRRHHHHQ